MYRRISLLFLTLITTLGLAARLGAVAPDIRDDGHFFSPETVRKANVAIHDLMKNYGRDLVVETFASVPAEQREKVKAMERDERSKFFHNWAMERVQALVVNGVYVLVSREPAHLQVEITPGADGSFDKATRDKLVQTLLKSFQAKRFDEGLDAAIQIVRERLAAAGSKPQSP
jgi:hypothetical protein